jgi:hypothetical protein
MTVALDYERAAKLAMAGELTEQQARKALNDILEKTNAGESLRCPTTQDWLDERLASNEASKSASSAERYGGVIEGFEEYLGERARRRLTTPPPRDVQGFLNKRQKAGCSATTVQLDGKNPTGLRLVPGFQAPLFPADAVFQEEDPALFPKQAVTQLHEHPHG